MKNILFLGNSYSEDTGHYFPIFANEANIDAYFEMLVYPGCSLDQHIDFISNKLPNYIHRQYDYEKNEWETIKEKTATEVISSRTWDIIVIQQCSAASGMEGTYNRIDELISEVKEICLNKDVKFIWNMTWAWPTYNDFIHKKEYFNDSVIHMHNMIINNVKEFVIPNKNIIKILTTGMAIYNAKSYYLEEKLYRDAVHLSFDLGRYIASLIAFKIMFDYDVNLIKYIPNNLNDVDRKNALVIINITLKNPYQKIE